MVVGLPILCAADPKSITESHLISIDPNEPGGCARILKLLEEKSLGISDGARSAMLEQTCAPGRDRDARFSVILLKENDDAVAVREAETALSEEQRGNIRRLMEDDDYRRELIRDAVLDRPRDVKSTERPLDFNREYFSGFVRDTYGIVKAPASWDSRDWGRAALLLVASGGIYANDERVRDWVQRSRNEQSDRIAGLAEPFGKELILPGLGLMYVAGKLTDNVPAVRTALLGLESAAITTLFIGGVKTLAARHRPYTGDGAGAFGRDSGSVDSHASLPSGHSGAAFAVAAVMASELGEEGGHAWVAPVAYGIATLTALSRMNDDEHWASDVFIGAAIGYSIGKWITSRHASSRGVSGSGSRSAGWQAYPVLDRRGRISLILEYPF